MYIGRIIIQINNVADNTDTKKVSALDSLSAHYHKLIIYIPGARGIRQNITRNYDIFTESAESSKQTMQIPVFLET